MVNTQRRKRAPDSEVASPHAAKAPWGKPYLADTSIRIYQRRDWRASLCLRSYLMIPTNAGFSLRAYLKSISCTLFLPSGQRIPFDSTAYSETSDYKLNIMMHDFSAKAVIDMPTVRHGIGLLRVDYHISFTGHPSEKPAFFEIHVPLVDRTHALRDWSLPRDAR